MTRPPLAATLVPILLLAFLLGGCAERSQPPLIATNVIINEPLPGRAMSAGYLSLTNTTNEVIRITHASSPQYESVQLHESLVENGVARMRPLKEIVIAPDSTVVFQAGGKHLMLMHASGAGDASLNFYDETTLLLSVSVPVTRRADQ